ncbi:MAG: hypothetical protein ACYDBW_08670 [Sulfuricaulis sp.]
MLHWFRRKTIPLARVLLASVASLWLAIAVAPCVMAAQAQETVQAAVPCPVNPGMTMSASDCDTVSALNCKLPNINSPLAAVLADHAVTPVLLTVLPVSFTPSVTGLRLRPDFVTPDNPAPPLYIRHLTLLI